MSEHELSLIQIKKEWHGTLKDYVIGFFTCLILTCASFGLVVYDVLSGLHLIYGLIALAIIQALVQVVLFLHVGQEEKPRWDIIVFVFMIVILLIVAIGSIWVMHDLNTRTMTM